MDKQTTYEPGDILSNVKGDITNFFYLIVEINPDGTVVLEVLGANKKINSTINLLQRYTDKVQ